MTPEEKELIRLLERRNDYLNAYTKRLERRFDHLFVLLMIQSVVLMGIGIYGLIT